MHTHQTVARMFLRWIHVSQTLVTRPENILLNIIIAYAHTITVSHLITLYYKSDIGLLEGQDRLGVLILIFYHNQSLVYKVG